MLSPMLTFEIFKIFGKRESCGSIQLYILIFVKLSMFVQYQFLYQFGLVIKIYFFSDASSIQSFEIHKFMLGNNIIAIFQNGFFSLISHQLIWTTNPKHQEMLDLLIEGIDRRKNYETLMQYFPSLKVGTPSMDWVHSQMFYMFVFQILFACTSSTTMGRLVHKFSYISKSCIPGLRYTEN